MTERKRIVVLDDNENFAMLLAAALEEHCEVASGFNGLHGIAFCLEGGVDAVVTDIGMPDFDGISMLREMRKHPRMQSIPVIVVTATHFNTTSREEVSRFPQVRRMISKDSGLENITRQIIEVLSQGTGCRAAR